MIGRFIANVCQVTHWKIWVKPFGLAKNEFPRWIPEGWSWINALYTFLWALFVLNSEKPRGWLVPSKLMGSQIWSLPKASLYSSQCSEWWEFFLHQGHQRYWCNCSMSLGLTDMMTNSTLILYHYTIDMWGIGDLDFMSWDRNQGRSVFYVNCGEIYAT